MNHSKKISIISQQIKERIAAGAPIKLKKDAVSHFVPNPYDKREKWPKVDISGLNEIISIDHDEMTCVAEPVITFADLVAETLKHGLIPMTVPELKGITIGGAISGCSIESMSYKYGGFHDSCLEYEIVDGRGNAISCSPVFNPDIFHMIHGSYGTLGILTKITFKLIPAKPYVRMSYVKLDNFEDFWRFLRERCKRDDHDFVDAIVHSPTEFVVCLGDMVDDAPYTSSYEWLNIFYKSTRSRKEDYLTISDYFFRYDTECHWLTKTVPLMETKPARLLLGKIILGSTNLIKWSKRIRSVMKMKRRPEVVVDVFIPEGNFGRFFIWYAREYKFFPLWIVPYKAPEIYPWIDDEHAKGMGEGLFIDAAVYGKKNSDPHIDYSEVLEKKTIEFGGIKTLISRNHFDRETFWKVYNRKNYESAKQRTDPANIFNDLYEKFKPDMYE